MGSFDSTIIHGKLAVENSPKMVPAWIALGKAYRNVDKPDSALWALQKALYWAPNNSQIYNNIGVQLYTQGENDEAREYFNKALDINPQLSVAYLNLGRMELSEGNTEKAIENLEMARSIDPDIANVHRELSTAYSAIGRNEEAYESWEKYLSLPGPKVGDFVGDEKAPGVLPPREKRGK